MVDQNFKHMLSNCRRSSKKISYILFGYNICNLFFLIGYWLFTPYIAFVPVKRYSTNNSNNNNIDNNKDKHIYEKMHKADWWQTTHQALIDSSIKNATIISVLLATDKTVLTKYAKNIAQQPVYLTISNLSHEI